MGKPSNIRTNQGIFQPSLITRVYKKNLNLQRSMIKNIIDDPLELGVMVAPAKEKKTEAKIP